MKQTDRTRVESFARRELLLLALVCSICFPADAGAAFGFADAEVEATEADQVDALVGDDTNFPTYTVLPGDVFDVIFSMDHSITSDDYVLDILDEIEIRCMHHEELNGTYRIRPDGKISLPYKGSLSVVNLTVDQLIERIRDLYSDIFKEPEIFINLTNFGAKVEELRKIVTSQNRGQVLRATIRSDGFVSLPMIGELHVSGRSPSDVDRLVQAGFAEIYRGIKVSVVLAETPSNVYYVLGQVENPGQYPIAAPITLTQALARAGVSFDTAGLKNVVVVSIDGNREPIATVVNLRAVFKNRDAPPNYLLSRHDVVFVPRSTIAKINQFMDQYVSKLLLFRGFTYVLGADQ